ncbi:DUF5366 family protein [Aliibacillus thermotolerans]|uniref:DUF5366 family protein n=1 Tax=Aliibacillus thermotolerans TaxID=1834418 RepID=A0ABW0U921_9BACI|nr:DUF5366 family protein [Aliibacillus thermotolerans]MDA3128548.1 hypothetical protein [Aliibacillus thermotolerans]
MKNTYITSYFPLFSITIFSFALAIYTETIITDWLIHIGLYVGMLEFFSEVGIKLTLLFLLTLVYFMVFSALKLIADTVLELSLLFFSRDEEGNDLKKVRSGSWIFLIASFCALFLSVTPQLQTGITIVFLFAAFIYFVYFVYQVSDSMSLAGLIGTIFFHVSFWGGFLAVTIYSLLRLYNSFVNSLPIS